MKWTDTIMHPRKSDTNEKRVDMNVKEMNIQNGAQDAQIGAQGAQIGAQDNEIHDWTGVSIAAIVMVSLLFMGVCAICVYLYVVRAKEYRKEKTFFGDA